MRDTKTIPNAVPSAELLNSGNVVMFPRRVPDFTDEERLELRRMMAVMKGIVEGCPTARRLARDE